MSKDTPTIATKFWPKHIRPYQERIRGGACNATVGWVESLLENDVTYGCGKFIPSNFHSPYKEST